MGASDTVWRQSLQSEAGVAARQCACALLWDFQKYYEGLNIAQVEARCVKRGFPAAISRLACQAYRGPRFLSLQGVISPGYYATSGVVAGCPFATTFIRINSLDGLDSICWHPCLSYSLYIDDNGLHAVGSYKDVLHAVTDGSRQLHRVISEDIGAKLAEDKAVLLCSNKALGADIQAELGASLTGPLCAASTNLGVDDSVGQPLRHAGRN